MKKKPNIFIALAVVFFFVSLGYQNNSYGQIIAKNALEPQLQKLTTDHQLKFPTLTRKFYANRKNQLIWFNSGQNLIWKAHGLLYNSGQYGLNPADFHCDQITAGLLNDLLLTEGSNNYKTVADILITDAMLNFINQLHYGMANPDFPLKKLDDERFTGLKAEVVLENAVESLDFEKEVLKVQPGFEGYKQLQQYLKLMVGQYTGDCYESTEETEKLMALNLERWRWFNSVETPYLLVNIPSFELQYHRGYHTETFRVIVGRSATPTPVLSSEIKVIKTSPEWTVPKNMVVKELLPKALKDPSYIRSNHFLIYDSKGNALEPSIKNLKMMQRNPSKYVIIQIPGGHNALGRIVFYMENPYHIYIHDTPDSSLFKKSNRALSQGGISVEHPDALVELLLVQNDLAAQLPTIRSAMLNSHTKVIRLPEAIPVFVGYFTCDTKDGILNNYKDVYHCDEALSRKMKLILK